MCDDEILEELRELIEIGDGDVGVEVVVGDHAPVRRGLRPDYSDTRWGAVDDE